MEELLLPYPRILKIERMDTEMRSILVAASMAIALTLFEGFLEAWSGFKFHPTNYGFVTYVHEAVIVILVLIYSKLRK